MTCLYPENTEQTAYKKGCRCDRCCAVKSVVDKRRNRPPTVCRDCGDPKVPGTTRCDPCLQANIVKRVADRVEIDPVTGCWIYVGTYTISDPPAYGVVATGVRKSQLAHRVMYEHFVGPIPEGYQVDHLCFNKPCCNPDHLEAVTPLENVQRSQRRFTHCPNGHPYGDQPIGKRKCKKCVAISVKRRYWERKAA